MELLSEIKNNIRYQVIKGTIDLDKLTEHLKDIYTAKDFNPGMDVFWDLTQADFKSIKNEEVYSFMRFVRENWGKDENVRAALVVPDDLGFGLSRMYEILMDNESKSDIKVFRDIDKATEWINKIE